MANQADVGQSNDFDEKKENGTVLDNSMQVFGVDSLAGDATHVEIVAKIDEKGDYPVLQFYFKDKEGKEKKFAVWRDEMAAITFALARQDQQSHLLNERFRNYKEVPVRLVIEAKQDIKKGDMVVAWRKERVPVDFDYTYEKFNNSMSFK